MNFIKLTNERGEDVWVNFDNVTYFHLAGAETRLQFVGLGGDTGSLLVKQKPLEFVPDEEFASRNVRLGSDRPRAPDVLGQLGSSSP